MTAKLLHIVSDQPFTDMVSREFNAVSPGSSEFICIGQSENLRHIRNAVVRFLEPGQLKEKIGQGKYAAVIFHSISDSTLPILGNIPAETRVVWVGWGFDYYHRLLADAYPDGLYLPLTQQVLADTHRQGSRVGRAVQTLRQQFRRRVVAPSRQRALEAYLSRVDIFIPVLRSEHALALKLNDWFQPAYVPWNYGTIEADFSDLKYGSTPLGTDILVGNSASPENNHVDVFDILERHVDLESRRVVVPLGYGPHPYKERVIAEGERRFGPQFVPLRGFLEKSEYLKELRRCGFVFMHHVRQQALGNICIALNNGARLFLNSRSPVYGWLASIDCTIDDSTELKEHTTGQRRRLRALTVDQQEANRQSILGHWGQDAQREKTRLLVRAILG